jgi:hypothetical protein
MIDLGMKKTGKTSRGASSARHRNPSFVALCFKFPI